MPGRNLHEAYLLVLTAVFAATAWASGSAEQTITATYPAWSQTVWYGGLIMGAIVGIVGIAWHSITGLLLERAALLGLAGLCGAYGSTFLLHASRADAGHAAFVVGFVVGYGVVNLYRARQIHREIVQYRAARLAALRALQPPEEAP